MQNEIIEAVLVYIDINITENINLELITEKAGYSIYHFSRVFSEITGISLIAYVTWRKLQFALSDISNGEKVIDAAVKYGFETHGGFAKAFKKCFGFPPSLCMLHVIEKRKGNINAEYNKEHAAELGAARSKKSAERNIENIDGNEWTNKELDSLGIDKDKRTRLKRQGILENPKKGVWKRVLN